MLATLESLQNQEVRMRSIPIYSRLSPIRWQPLPSLWTEMKRTCLTPQSTPTLKLLPLLLSTSRSINSSSLWMGIQTGETSGPEVIITSVKQIKIIQTQLKTMICSLYWRHKLKIILVSHRVCLHHRNWILKGCFNLNQLKLYQILSQRKLSLSSNSTMEVRLIAVVKQTTMLMRQWLPLIFQQFRNTSMEKVASPVSKRLFRRIIRSMEAPQQQYPLRMRKLWNLWILNRV
jgi:hypothetical protein